MQILSYILTGITLVLIIVMLITFRKVRSVSVKTPLVSIAISLVGFVIFKVIIGTSLSTQLLWVLAIVGAILGMWQGKKTNVWVEDGKAKAKNTIWFVVVWLVGFGFGQLLVVTGQALSMNLGIGALSLSTGVTIGAQGMLLIKLVTARSKEESNFSNRSSANQAGTKNSTEFGRTPVAPSKASSPNQITSTRCLKCGAGNTSSQNYCGNCGEKISAVRNTQSQATTSLKKTTPRKASGAWWILAFIPVIGIIVVWAALRKKDPPLVNRIFIVNFGLTMLILINIFQNRK